MRRLNEVYPDWVCFDIPGDRQEVPILLDDEALVPSLPHVAARPVMTVIPSHMAGHEPLHEFAQVIGLFGRKKQMEVIGHETIAHQLHRMLLLCLSQ